MPSRAEPSCQWQMERVRAASRAYSGDHGGSYPESVAQLVPRYLDELPRCPQTREGSYGLCCHFSQRQGLAPKQEGRNFTAPVSWLPGRLLKIYSPDSGGLDRLPVLAYLQAFLSAW